MNFLVRACLVAFLFFSTGNIGAQPFTDPQPLPETPAEECSEIDCCQISTDEDAQEIITGLKSPLEVMPEKKYMRAGWVTLKSNIPETAVISTESGTSAIRDESITVQNLNAAPGTLFRIVSIGETVRHPRTGANMGAVIHAKGIARFVNFQDGRANCIVVESFEPILQGDLLVPYSGWESRYFDAWVKPAVPLKGLVFALGNPLLSVHLDDFVYIDLGEKDGVRPGDRFLIYSRNDGTLTGELEIISVLAEHSAAMVVALRSIDLSVGDAVELYATCRIVQR